MVRRLLIAVRVATPLAGLAAALISLALPMAAQAQQDLRPVYERIDRLQRDLDTLQRNVARGRGSAAPAGSAGAVDSPSTEFIDRTEARFQGLEDQVRDLTGRIEQLSNDVQKLSTRLDKLVSDVDFRLNAIEKGGAGGAQPAPGQPPSGQSGNAAPAAPANAGQNAANLGQAHVPPGQQRLVLTPGGPNPPPAAPAQQQAATGGAAGAVQLPQGSPEAQYEFAYGVLLQAQREQADFGRAEQALRAFVNANPTHRLAGNAQYWLGETYYVRRDYKDAAAAFAEGLQKYPKSDKGPDNLLKLGMSLARLNRKNEACGALAEVEKRYPQAPAQIKQTAQRERSRAGCG